MYLHACAVGHAQTCDGSWTVSFWFTKTGCTTGPWEYIYSHAKDTSSISSPNNANINGYVGCDDVGSGTFHRTIMVDDASNLLTYDIPLANVGNFDAVTQRWVHYVYSVANEGLVLVIPMTSAWYPKD